MRKNKTVMGTALSTQVFLGAEDSSNVTLDSFAKLEGDRV